MTIMSVNALVNQIEDFFAGAPTQDEIIAYQIPQALDVRLQYLMDRNNDGDITSEERKELEHIVSWTNFLTNVALRAELKKAGKR